MQVLKIRFPLRRGFLAGMEFRISLHFNAASFVFVKLFTNYKRSTSILAVLLTTTWFLSQCVDRQPLETPDVPEPKAAVKTFAGSESCSGCHKSIYDDHLRTAHFLTSQPGEEQFIRGSFEQGRNVYGFGPNTAVVMEKRDDGFYQVEYSGNEMKRAEKMDIVVGSGTMGQSSLYWRDHYLFQMPITYFSDAKQWSNSPGFPNRVVFNRVITSRCLECHTTNAEVISEPGKEPEKFNRNSIVYGVDCEKCHGPAVDHVKFHSENPKDTVAKHIINPATFTRQQKLDLCALCHGGRLQKTQPSFSFTAGDALSDYFRIDTTVPDPRAVDVHGNQYALMRASKCFKASDVLTCNTCHDVHKNEKGKTALFSQRCISCHGDQHETICPKTKELGKNIANNCIDCHMPLNPSRAIAVYLPDGSSATAARIRSHFVAVYPDESARLMQEMIRGAKVKGEK